MNLFILLNFAFAVAGPKDVPLQGDVEIEGMLVVQANEVVITTYDGLNFAVPTLVRNYKFIDELTLEEVTSPEILELTKTGETVRIKGRLFYKTKELYADMIRVKGRRYRLSPRMD